MKFFKFMSVKTLDEVKLNLAVIKYYKVAKVGNVHSVTVTTMDGEQYIASKCNLRAFEAALDQA